MSRFSTFSGLEFKSVGKARLKVTRDEWVVSIVRKPQGENSEHVFLLVEGINSHGQAVLRRYDLFQNSDEKNKGLVKIRNETVEIKNANKQMCENRIFLNNDDVCGKSWQIESDKAEALHQSVLLSEKNPPDYCALGDKSVLGSSSKSRIDPGQSCYTWAQNQLKGQGISLPTDYNDVFVKYLVAWPSLSLKSDETAAACILA